MSWAQFFSGVQGFFGSPVGAGVGFVGCIYLVVDIIKKVK